VPDEVTEAGQRRDDKRADDQLRRLEPVDVGVGDAEVVGDVAEDRRVVALQGAAGQLDADEEADDCGEAAHRGTQPAGGAQRGSLSISRRYQRMPSRNASTPRCSSYEWIDSRCALVMRNGAKR
jgi:hypothetical protein